MSTKLDIIIFLNVECLLHSLYRSAQKVAIQGVNFKVHVAYYLYCRIYQLTCDSRLVQRFHDKPPDLELQLCTKNTV